VTKKSLETKPLRTLKGKKLSGSLATPICTGGIVPNPRDDLPEHRRAEFVERHRTALHRQRMAKMPDLAQHLGIDFEHLDLTKPGDMASLCSEIALNLASLLIPGFQEKGGARIWPDALVFDLLIDIEKKKQDGTIASDLDGCILKIKELDPETKSRSERTRKARTLANRVAGLRAELKRALAQKDLQKS
jgi:hypothetical protein